MLDNLTVWLLALFQVGIGGGSWLLTPWGTALHDDDDDDDDDEEEEEEEDTTELDKHRQYRAPDVEDHALWRYSERQRSTALKSWQLHQSMSQVQI